MSTRDDHLVAALEAIQARVAARDALGAEEAMVAALAAFGAQPGPSDDPRLAPLLQACEAAARAYHAELGEAVKDSGLRARAGQAYGRGSAP